MKLDFFRIEETKIVKNVVTFHTIKPVFLIRPSKDLMIRGEKFYAVYDESTGLWETDEYKVQKFIDEEIDRKANELEEKYSGDPSHRVIRKYMEASSSGSWAEYKAYTNRLPDHFHQLDSRLCFDGENVKREDYISKRLPYRLENGPYDAWDKLVGTLYAPEEREKIEWAIGSIVAGDSKDIQKFIVLYGDPGAGKGTILNIIQKLFPGYYEVFDAKSLGGNNNAFPFEQFRSNPLIALQMDGDLSKIEDNTKLNSLISHETILMNEKRKQSYSFKPRCFLFMASNKEVKITDAKSGLIRRLIDVCPTNQTLPKREYDTLMAQINFELSGIAYHCLQVYRGLGKNYYNGYRPTKMMFLSNSLFNFLKDSYEDPEKDIDGIQLFDLYADWLIYCSTVDIRNTYMRSKFGEEVKTYYREFYDQCRVDGKHKRNWLCGLKTEKFQEVRGGRKEIFHDGPTTALVLDQKVSILDDILKDCLAQYAEDDGHGGSKPIRPWAKTETTLKNLDTTKLHFVKPPLKHIVIDFDLKNEKGEKDQLKNLEAADKWPKTYAEYSQGGKGIHLHYIYAGDPKKLKSVYDKDIEIKVFDGGSALRRRLSACNNIPVAILNVSADLEKEVTDDSMLDFESVKDEKHIRNIIAKCLKKDIQQPYTTPAMSLIKKTLDDAWNSGIKYDIRDLRPSISSFASKSHNQKDLCMKMANDLHYFSKHFDEEHKWTASAIEKLEEVAKDPKRIEAAMDIYDTTEARSAPRYSSEIPVFFDIEVFPNLMLVNWKEQGKGKGVVRMINPTRSEIGELLHKKLIGFNCRRYDNHILYARYIGYDIPAIYKLSRRIVSGSNNAMFGPAYNISYTDVLDFAAKKQSLKKWEIELGIHHQELGLPWDQPVPEEKWAQVAEYCDNDVIATEAVFDHLAGDFKAREILADIAGMSVNDTTNMLTTKIIFGDDPKPQVQFNYPNLAKEFPGYKFENGKSTLNGVEVGEGGRVYAVPGIYHHVTTYDVASMHPSSIIAENGFGKYTERFKQLMDIRVAIKHKDFESAKKMLDGKLAKYLTDKDQAKSLSQALKIAINSVYGLTAAGFDNKFRDPRNKDNWVAKRGALFMEDLRLRVQAMGATVVHIKTDSIKVQDPTPEIENYILERGKQFGYTFEVEDLYDKICLVNDAVYIAYRNRNDPGWLDEMGKAMKKAEESHTPYVEPTRWTATGAQFQHPYVFKTLFSHESLEFQDLCETKSVTSALYLDMNENLSDVSAEEADLEKLEKRVKTLLKTLGYLGNWDDWLQSQDHEYNPSVPLSPVQILQIESELRDLVKDRDALKEIISKGHNYIFVGKAGSFCPVKSGCGGGILTRETNGKFNSATGCKGYRWREGETLIGSDRMDMIDMGYFESLAETAKKAIETYGPFDEFVREEELIFSEQRDPWDPPCGAETCNGCANYDTLTGLCKKQTPDK